MMADAKWKAGDRARYKGIMENRRDQVVEVVCVGDLISCRFPDGKTIGCAPHSLGTRA